MKNYKLFIIFLFISLMVSACARVDNVAESGNIKIEINRSNAREGGDQISDVPYYLDISLNGEYTDNETIQVGAKNVVQFKKVPLGVSVYATASYYKKIDGEKKVLYTGKSDSIVVGSGTNNLIISFKGTGIDDPYNFDPYDIDLLFNLAEKIYVASQENGGNDDKGDGTEAKPFRSFIRAVSKMNNAKMIYAIMVDGELTDYQRISGLSQDPNDADAPNHASMVIISGVNGNDTDGINVNSSIDSYGLMINTDVDVLIANFKIQASDYNILTVETDANLILSKDVIITNTAYKPSADNLGNVISVSGSLTMMENSQITGINSYNSPVNVQGTFDMTQNSSISDCSSRQAGAVTISAPNADFSMMNYASITGCHCVDDSDGMAEFGGGVHINSDAEDAEFSMAGNSKIQDCSALYGGGALIENGQMSMFQDASVSGNTASAHGGGVSINTNGSLAMYGGSINGNIVEKETNMVYGGGVFNAGTLEMTGGFIGENYNSINSGYLDGSGVYNKHIFQIGGDAYIADDNDVYLDNDTGTGNKAYITIMSHLTHDHVAKIITYDMEAADQGLTGNDIVLVAEEGVNLANEYMKFTSGIDHYNTEEYNTIIDENGYLRDDI